jgi:hypothetical protein
MTIFASIRFLNHSMLRHSSRNLPLKLSFDPFCHGLPGSMCCHAPPRPLSRHLQPMQAPEAVRPVGTHPVATALQEDLDAPISVTRILGRQFMHHGHCRRITCHQPRLVTHGGPGHAQQRARSSYRSTPLAYVGDLLTTHGRAHHFFAATSFRISMSRTRSASSSLSRPFSCSSWRRRFTSTASSCPTACARRKS